MGKIDFIGTNAISLRGGSVRISSDRAASDPADAVMTPGSEAPALNKANVTISTAGNPVFNGRITTDGDITVTGGGQFRLARSQAVVLKGGNITLTASQPPLDGRHPITIEAKGNLNLNTGLDTSMALTLEAGAGASTGAINFDQDKATIDSWCCGICDGGCGADGQQSESDDLRLRRNVADCDGDLNSGHRRDKDRGWRAATRLQARSALMTRAISCAAVWLSSRRMGLFSRARRRRISKMRKV